MTAQLADLLPEVVGDVISTQAFAFADPCESEDLMAHTDSCIYAQIAFQGPTSGMLKWAVPESLSTELAINILGIDDDEDIDEEDAHDAIKEVLNVVCGQLLTRLYGSDPVFTLSIPHTEKTDASEWTKIADDAQMVGVGIDDTPTAIWVTIAEETP